MIKLYLILLALILNISSLKAAELPCETVRDKIDLRCSKILKGAGSKASGFFGSLRKFSDKNKTITQSLGMDEKEKKKPTEITLESLKSLRKFSDKNKTITQSLGMDEKEKKKPTELTLESLKKFSKEHKTINNTIEKHKKK